MSFVTRNTPTNQCALLFTEKKIMNHRLHPIIILLLGAILIHQCQIHLAQAFPFVCYSSSGYRRQQSFQQQKQQQKNDAIRAVNNNKIGITNNKPIQSERTVGLYKKNETLSSLEFPSKFPITATTVVSGPPLDSKPNYEEIVGPLGKIMDLLFMVVFRMKLADQMDKYGGDSKRPLTDYKGITELASRMNRLIHNRQEVQQRAQETLRSLFPSWLPKQYAILFSKPLPAFSARMNAWATYVAGTWLMGECEVNDVVLDDGEVLRNQGLLVKRCRFLEESQCASVCVNSCKIPTQNFFLQDMGLPLTMEPDYDTFECQFSFGKMPTQETERLAKSTPCLLRCPVQGALRQEHDNHHDNFTKNNTISTTTANSLVSLSPPLAQATLACEMMGDDDVA